MKEVCKAAHPDVTVEARASEHYKDLFVTVFRDNEELAQTILAHIKKRHPELEPFLEGYTSFSIRLVGTTY